MYVCDIYIHIYTHTFYPFRCFITPHRLWNVTFKLDDTFYRSPRCRALGRVSKLSAGIRHRWGRVICGRTHFENRFIEGDRGEIGALERTARTLRFSFSARLRFIKRTINSVDDFARLYKPAVRCSLFLHLERRKSSALTFIFLPLLDRMRLFFSFLRFRSRRAYDSIWHARDRSQIFAK